MNIKFKDLREISNTLSKGDEDFLIDYLNQFKGENIYEKLHTILKAWEEDVNHSMSFSVDDKNIKVTLSYAIECFSGLDASDIEVETDQFTFMVGIPDKFINGDVFDFVYSIKKVKYLEHEIDMLQKSNEERTHLINSMPAELFNKVTKEILSNDNYTKGFDNPSLKHLKINFLNNSAYMFLRGLFEPYSKDYFRDIIYHLSKKIDGDILMNSTISDIEYYIDKMNDENAENEIPNLA